MKIIALIKGKTQEQLENLNLVAFLSGDHYFKRKLVIFYVLPHQKDEHRTAHRSGLGASLATAKDLLESHSHKVK